MNLPKRKQNRLNHYDYNTRAAYFITICTLNRKSLLSKVVGDGVLDVPENYAQTERNGVGDGVLDVPQNPPQIKLFYCGKIAEKILNQMNDFYDDISVDKYVIMPDHIHFIMSVNGVCSSGMSRTPSPTACNNPKLCKTNSAVAKFVSTFKRFCHKEIGKPIWQRSYYDHVIRDQNDYNEKCEYIENNPTKRAIMKTDKTVEKM